MSYIKRLRWLILLGGFCASCYTGNPDWPYDPTQPLQAALKAHPGLGEAQAVVWRTGYGRTDASPLVYVVEGAALDCRDPHNDQPGFRCPTIGCREGCTALPIAVAVALRLPWSASALAHEDMHALKMRRAIEVLRYTPVTAVMALLADRDHKGPEWEPGGDVDRANVMLRAGGM